MAGTLYIVATPIGNLQDISPRALETLRSVDLIACEDTRHTRKLLTHYGISAKLLSYHEHNEESRATELARMLEEGKSIAVVSDAGTPGIADPSFLAVRRAHEIGARVVSIPGPAAFVSAAVVSGIPTDALFFGGFLPSKKGDRLKRLEEVRSIPATLVFYEAPHRLSKSVADCFEVLGKRRAAVVREITKLHEEILTGDLEDLSTQNLKLKGEIVLVIERARTEESDSRLLTPAGLIARVEELEREGTDHRSALKKAAKEFGLSKSEAYKILISQK